MDGKSKKMLLVGIAVVLIALYRVGTPYMEHTAELQKEAEKLEKKISEVAKERFMYGKGWEDNMARQEAELATRLPDTINASEILNYFINEFEKKNVGKAWFLSVNHQRATNSEFRHGKGNRAPRARVARFKIKSELSQDKVVAYIDHIEGYAGLVRMENYGFSVAKERAGALEVDLALDFFLTPKEWVPKSVLAEIEEEESAGPEQQKSWKEIFVSTGERGLAHTGAPGKLPPFTKIVGRSVVANESLFEEGDTIAGWKIQSIDGGTKRVILKWGTVTKEVSVK